MLRAFLGLREILWEVGLRRTRTATQDTRNEPVMDATEQPGSDLRSPSGHAPERALDDDLRPEDDERPSGQSASHAHRPRVQRVDVKG